MTAVEVSLLGLSTNAQTTDQLFLGFLAKIKKATIETGVAAEDLPVPETHPNSVLVVEEFFSRLSGCFGERPVVVLLDFRTRLAASGIRARPGGVHCLLQPGP